MKKDILYILCFVFLGTIIWYENDHLQRLKVKDVYTYLNLHSPDKRGQSLRGDNCLTQWEAKPIYVIVRQNEQFKIVRIKSQEIAARTARIYRKNQAMLFEVVNDAEKQHLRFWLRNGDTVEHFGNNTRLAGTTDGEYYLPSALVNVLWVIN